MPMPGGRPAVTEEPRLRIARRYSMRAPMNEHVTAERAEASRDKYRSAASPLLAQAA